MLELLIQRQVPGQHAVHFTPVLRATNDGVLPVAGQQPTVTGQAGHRLLDHLQPVGGIQVVTHFTEHDQVEAPAWPVCR
ncbi:hypothetical protein D3C81_1953670 [compost metagenome]